MNTHHLPLLRQFHETFASSHWTHVILATKGNARAAQQPLEALGASVVCLDAQHNLIGIVANQTISGIMDAKLYPDSFADWTDTAKQQWASKNKPVSCCEAIYSRKEIEQIMLHSAA